MSCHVFCRTAVLPGLPDGIHIFKPKIQIWVNFGGSCKVGVFCVHLVYFTAICHILHMDIWHISWLLHRYIFLILVSCRKKNLATLSDTRPEIPNLKMKLGFKISPETTLPCECFCDCNFLLFRTGSKELFPR
jgi:hypothetical protein